MDENIQDIYFLLQNKAIKAALMKLESLAREINEWEIGDEVHQMLVSYNMMVMYTIQGIKDPNMQEMIRKTSSQAFNILDRLAEIKRIRLAGSYMSKISNRIDSANISYEEILGRLEKYTENMGTADLLYSKEEVNDKKLEIAKEHEEALNDMFDKTILTLKWHDSDYQQAQDIMSSVLIANVDKAIFVSAMTMALAKVFDDKKFMLLISSYDDPDPEISQRALIGIVIILQTSPKRVNDYPDVMARLSILKDNKHIVSDLRNIQLQFLMTRETNNIEKKMREDIIPEMIRKSDKNEYNKFFYDTEDKESENPDWKKMIADSDLSDMIKEMNDLQTSGADVYMSSFSMLKNYSFFFKMSHWFYPFFTQQYDIYPIMGKLDNDKISMFKIIFNSSYFCNSDKYSISFTLQHIPEVQKDMFIKQFTDMGPGDEDKEEALKMLQKEKRNKEVIIRQYIQDLYRFFRLWHYKSEEKDIFKDKFDLWNNPYLADIVADTNTLGQIGSFLLKYNYMEEAEQIYQLLTEQDQNDSESWQKQGYALQKLYRYEEAISCYLKSDMISPDRKWTNHHLAQCYKKSGDFAKAIEYYKKVEAIVPDDLSITAQIGQCLINLQDYKNALQYFFKIQYIDEKNVNAQRAIGWCMLQTGKYEESKKYFSLVKQSEKYGPNDIINLGHLFVLEGNIAEGVDRYKTAISLLSDMKEKIKYIDEIKQFLTTHDINKEYISIMTDLII